MPTARIIRQIRQLQFVIIVRSQRRRSSAAGLAGLVLAAPGAYHAAAP